jgi:hypothetical protein
MRIALSVLGFELWCLSVEPGECGEDDIPSIRLGFQGSAPSEVDDE